MTKILLFPLFTLRNTCCGYLLESPQRGDSNKYPRHVFLGILITILFNFSNNPFHLELKIRSVQNVVITSFVVISNVGIKRFDCSSTIYQYAHKSFVYTGPIWLRIQKNAFGPATKFRNIFSGEIYMIDINNAII